MNYFRRESEGMGQMTDCRDSQYVYRRAVPADADVLANLRRQQLLDEGMTELQNIDLEMKVFFQEKLSSQALHQWVVEADGEIIATAAFLIVDLPPNFRNPSGKRGYITNVYTAPAHRRKGISGRLMDILVQEAGETGITSMWLFASEQGESVYRKAGFTKRNDCMGWDAPAGACP